MKTAAQETAPLIALRDCSVLSKTIYKFSATPFEIPRAYFIELEQIILKVVANHKKIMNYQNDLEQEEQSWKSHPP